MNKNFKISNWSSESNANDNNIGEGRKAFEVQMYPCKEHIEIMAYMFGDCRCDLDFLFSQFDYISESVMEIGKGWNREQYHIIQKGNLYGVLKYSSHEFRIHLEPKYVHIIPENNAAFIVLDTNFRWFTDILGDEDVHEDEEDEKTWHGSSGWSWRDLEDAYEAAYEI